MVHCFCSTGTPTPHRGAHHHLTARAIPLEPTVHQWCLPVALPSLPLSPGLHLLIYPSVSLVPPLVPVFCSTGAPIRYHWCSPSVPPRLTMGLMIPTGSSTLLMCVLCVLSCKCTDSFPCVMSLFSKSESWTLFWKMGLSFPAMASERPWAM